MLTLPFVIVAPVSSPSTAHDTLGSALADAALSPAAMGTKVSSDKVAIPINDLYNLFIKIPPNLRSLVLINTSMLITNAYITIH
jgi:hypothetical protein